MYVGLLYNVTINNTNKELQIRHEVGKTLKSVRVFGGSLGEIYMHTYKHS